MTRFGRGDLARGLYTLRMRRFLALLWAYKVWWLTSLLVLLCALVLVLASSAQLAFIQPIYSRF